MTGWCGTSEAALGQPIEGDVNETRTRTVRGFSESPRSFLWQTKEMERADIKAGSPKLPAGWGSCVSLQGWDRDTSPAPSPVAGCLWLHTEVLTAPRSCPLGWIKACCVPCLATEQPKHNHPPPSDATTNLKRRQPFQAVRS